MRFRAFAAIALFALSAQAAEQLGSIVFPNSGKPEAQQAFLRGVLLLHNFAYPQAAQAFLQAEAIDPQFALAYWGEAMTYNHPIWYETDVEAGRKALAKFSGTVTPRERAYLDAVATLYNDGPVKYEAAMER